MSRPICKRFITAAALAALAAAGAAAWAAGLDTLAGSKVGDFPKSWRTWPAQRDKAAEVYRVAEEGSARYLKAFDDRDLSQQIFFRFNWRVGEQPILSWRWRATALPAGAAESNDATNDSACSVYVIIGQYQGHAMKYVWSSSLAPGTVVSRRDGKLKIKVMDSGAARKGSWVSRSVDVLADYESLFGQKLDKNPSGIAVLTDGNAVHKPAGCDYADFAVNSRY